MIIDIFIDYTCPFCFLAEKYLNDISKSFPQIQFKYQLCEAHPLPEPRMVPKKDSRFWRETMPSMAKENNITVNFPYSPTPYSSVAIQGLIALEQQGADPSKYHSAMFDMVYVHSADIEDADIIIKAMDGYDLNFQLIRKQLEDKVFEHEQLKKNEFAYIENKIEVFPTFVLGEKRLVAKPGIGLTKEEIVNWLTNTAK